MLDYYSVTKQASSKIEGHPGLIYLQQLCQKADKILDVGCGEGSRLKTLLPKGKSGWGIDISSEAISRAKSQYPKNHFQVANAQKQPFEDASFDLVYSAFAIEHCSDPKKFVDEMIRVCRPGGQVVILCPNYGAPNRRSPVSVQKPLLKLISGFLKDFFMHPGLNWRCVTPLKTYDYIDADTTVEPYLRSLKQYLASQKTNVLVCSSEWELEPTTKNIRKAVTLLLGQRNIFPFKYWGPQIFIACQKI